MSSCSNSITVKPTKPRNAKSVIKYKRQKRTKHQRRSVYKNSEEITAIADLLAPTS